MDFEAAYTSQVSQAEMQHYTLAALSLPPTQTFNSYLTGDYDCYPGLDDALPVPVTGATMNSVPSNPVTITPPESILDCNESIVMQRYNGNISPTYSTSEMSCAPSYTTVMETPSYFGQPYLGWQPVAPLSPPPEAELEAQLVEDDVFAQEDPSVCEYLGPSSIQAYRFVFPSSGKCQN
jgi:hypothetical protein